MADEIIIETTSQEVIEVGTPGPQGATGQGVPVGGTTGQVLRKVSGTNYDTEWAAAGSGSGSVTSVALAGTGLSISGSPITTSGTITANVSYGTTAGTAAEGNDARLSDSRTPVSHSHGNITNAGLVGTTSGLPLKTGTGGIVEAGAFGTSAGQFAQGNDSRISNITANSITTAQGANSGGAGGTITMRGGVTGSNGAGGNAGSINLRGSDDRDEGAFNGGSIDLSASNGAGGNITSTGNSEGAGGSLNMSGNSFAGGSINTSGGVAGAGGSIDTSNDGGSINTRGTGSIGFGESGTRTTLTGTATENRAISLPNAGGTLALTQQATDYEVTDETKGVIMKSPNGTRWRVTIDNSGTLLRTALALIASAFLMCGAQAQVRDLVYGTNNVVIGPTNTNALSFTNSVSLPISSGAATTNSILTADGAGGSAFVASRTQTVAMTNSAFRTNTTDSSTNNAQAGMAVSLDANSTYHFAYAFVTTSSSTGGFGASLRHNNTTNGLRSTYVGRQGRPINVSATDITAASSGVIALQAVNFAGTNVVTTGTGILSTGTASGTLTLCWHQNTATNVASELVTGSMMTVTKISP